VRDENNTPLISQPISEIKMDKMDQQYVSRVQWYLEHHLHCRITSLSDREGYIILFPEGTVEETYMGQSTQWTRRTTIRFPDGATLQKYVTSPLNATQRGQTMLAFPNSVLDGPEPPPVQREPATWS
jgi:hypothetical protein